MITRVTNQQTIIGFIQQITQTRSLMEDTRDQISSGLRVSKASDDPARAGVISQFQSTLQRIDRHKSRIGYATSFLSFQEDALAEATNLIVRGKEIAEQASNETLSSDLRENLAEEVFALRDSLVGLANSTYQGRFVYGAADDDDPPFDADTYVNSRFPGDPAGVRYVFDAEDGTSSTRSVQVSDDDTIRINTPGDQVFSNGVAALERLGRALAGFRTEPEDLSGLPDGNGVAFVFPQDYHEQTSDLRETIDLLEDARIDISEELTSVGGRQNQVVQANNILTTLSANLESARSTYQDADIFLAASNLANLEISLQGTLAAGARVQGLSLLDFLG